MSCPALLLSVFVSFMALAVADNAVRIDLCDLCRALDEFVPDVGGSHAATGSASSCNPSTCLHSNKLRLVWNYTNAILSSTQAPVLRQSEADSMLFNLTESASSAHLLVWAFLGRHVVSTLAPGSTLTTLPTVFKYNIISQTLDVTRPACEYEKGFYMALLIASVVIIIAALALRFLESRPMQSTQPPPSLNEGAAQHTPATARTRFGSAQNVPDLRYRLLPTAET